MKRILLGAALASSAVTAWLLACGFIEDYRTVERIYPAHVQEYAKGNVGVVRPLFARRFLVQAYRVYSGQPPLAHAVMNVPFYFNAPHPEPARPNAHAYEGWTAMRLWAIQGGVTPRPQRPLSLDRAVTDYQWIMNCLDDALATASATLKARVERYGHGSAQASGWLSAQDAVFANCSAGPLVLPEPAPKSADALTQADRAYQTASAYFYGLEYDEAARRFRAIGGDAASPWRPYGRFLAARALIRQATVKAGPDAATHFAAAETDLNAVLADPASSALHASARRLLDYVALRARPLEQLAALSSVLARDREVAEQKLIDYQLLMDRLVGNTTNFAFGSVDRRPELEHAGDLTDWIVTLQGTGDDALAHALERWKTARATPWLVAALWKVPPRHHDAPALLDAAAKVERRSPPFATVAFLRVRLLARRGQIDEARAILAELPIEPAPGFPPEAINLLAAERFMLARSLDEFLTNATRTIVTDSDSKLAGTAAFDQDAGFVFSMRLPLDRLIDASSSETLPKRLRARVAAAAFTRAVLLRRYPDALRVLPLLERLAPAMRQDLRRFAAAGTDDDRHIAAVFLMLRTPGLDFNVRGMDDGASIDIEEPDRKFDHPFRRNWWCGLRTAPGQAGRESDSEVVPLLYADGFIPSPAFLTAAERADMDRELAALAKIGTAPNYLAAEAVKWAMARPTDLDAAEALAHAVQGTRWGCTDDTTRTHSRRAFQTRHRLFPKTEWARRTKYWY